MCAATPKKKNILHKYPALKQGVMWLQCLLQNERKKIVEFTQENFKWLVFYHIKYIYILTQQKFFLSSKAHNCYFSREGAQGPTLAYLCTPISLCGGGHICFSLLPFIILQRINAVAYGSYSCFPRVGCVPKIQQYHHSRNHIFMFMHPIASENPFWVVICNNQIINMLCTPSPSKF